MTVALLKKRHKQTLHSTGILNLTAFTWKRVFYCRRLSTHRLLEARQDCVRKTNQAFRNDSARWWDSTYITCGQSCTSWNFYNDWPYEKLQLCFACTLVEAWLTDLKGKNLCSGDPPKDDRNVIGKHRNVFTAANLQALCKTWAGKRSNITSFPFI